MTEVPHAVSLVNGKPLNRMNDIFAKFIFANEDRKWLTLDLINSVFQFNGSKEIVDFDFRDRELDPDSEAAKTLNCFSLFTGQRTIGFVIMNRTHCSLRVYISLQAAFLFST